MQRRTLRRDDERPAHPYGCVNRAVIGVRPSLDCGRIVGVASDPVARSRRCRRSRGPGYVVGVSARHPMEGDRACRYGIRCRREGIVRNVDRRRMSARRRRGRRWWRRGRRWIRGTAVAAPGCRDNRRNHQPTRHRHSSSISGSGSCDFDSGNVLSYTRSRQTAGRNGVGPWGVGG